MTAELKTHKTAEEVIALAKRFAAVSEEVTDDVAVLETAFNAAQITTIAEVELGESDALQGEIGPWFLAWGRVTHKEKREPLPEGGSRNAHGWCFRVHTGDKRINYQFSSAPRTLRFLAASALPLLFDKLYEKISGVLEDVEEAHGVVSTIDLVQAARKARAKAPAKEAKEETQEP